MIPRGTISVIGPRTHRAASCSLVKQRRHATTSSSGSTHDWPKSRKPSPYEIFGQHRHAPYCKAKFYELVKIYHPDTQRQASPDTSVSDAVRLERYRLIVAANIILSDPAKRRSYDRFGLGWDGPAGVDAAADRATANRSWRNEPGNASMNATWEDWERWYAERDGRVYAKQQPLYMSNGMFVVVLCLLVMVGSVGQARRANASTMTLVEAREQNHLAINDGIRRRQVDQATLNRHERVEHFLRQRDGWRLGDDDLHEQHERSKEVAPPREPRGKD